MTPIFVRPVREQLEHDRLIRFLQAKFKRKFDAITNIGDAPLGSVRLGNNAYFPDVVLLAGKKLAGVIEVETAESTNNLEAMAQWTHFSRARVPFSLYVPVLQFDAARRLCDAHRVAVSEIWTYRAVNDQFDLVRMFSDAHAVKNAARVSVKATFQMLEPPKVEPPPPPPPAPKPEVVTVKKGVSAKNAAPVIPTKAVKPAQKPAVAAVAKAVMKKPAAPSKPAKPAKKVKPAKPKKTTPARATKSKAPKGKSAKKRK